MAQVQSPTQIVRPTTPPQRPLNAPLLSPSRIAAAQRPVSQYRSGGHLNLDILSPVDQNGSFCFDRVIKSGKVHRRIKKKGAWKASWQSSYLVLRPNLLSIYKNENETNLRASIALSDITAVARVRKANHDNVFGVFSPSKNYHFKCGSEQETADWVNQVRLEARADEYDMETFDPPQPPYSQPQKPLPASDTTDQSADDSPDAPGSPEAPAWSVRGKERLNSKPQTSEPRQIPGKQTATRENTAPAEPQGTTSVSSFSDFASSLPKQNVGYLSASIPKINALSPIASAQQLRPSEPIRNVSQTSINDLSTHPDRIIRQGYLSLHRPSRPGRSWKPLWCVLRAKSLTFYKDEHEYETIKLLPLGGIIDAAEIDPVGRGREFCFQVIVEEKTYKFSCDRDGEEGLVGWVGAIKSVLAKRDEKRRERGKSTEVVEAVGTMRL